METLVNILYKILSKNLKLEKLLRKLINNFLDLYENIFYPYPNKCLEIKKIPPKNILIFSFGHTGDFAYYSSFTNYLKKTYPQVKINCVIPNNKRIIYVASLDKNVDKLIPVNFPRFFTFKFYEKFKKKLNYDISIIVSPYPNLRFLLPYLNQIYWPYFLFKTNIFEKIPPPKLTLDFKINKKNYIFINFEFLTFNFDNNFLNQSEVKKLIIFLAQKFPYENFIINKFLNFNYENLNFKNVKFFSGDYKALIKTSSQSKLAILTRSGLVDVLAATTKKLPLFIIYPNSLYPGKNGVPFINIYGIKNIGYKNKIEEFIYDHNKINSYQKLQKALIKFISENK